MAYNAKLTYEGRGGTQDLEFDLISHTRGLDLNMPDATLRNRMDFFPIRFAEQTFRFTVEVSVMNETDSRSRINLLRQAISTHMISCLNSKQPKPMILTYIPTSQVFKGVIEQFQFEANTSYTKKTYSFVMRMFGEYSDTQDYSKIVSGGTAPYVPKVANITPNTEWWTSVTTASVTKKKPKKTTPRGKRR